MAVVLSDSVAIPSEASTQRRTESLKLHHFRDAVAIAEHGSLRAAARHLGIAQPTLTRGLADLERELGAPLFERRSKGMLATRFGEAFVKTCDRDFE